MYTVVPVNNRSFSDKSWQEYFKLLGALHERYQSVHLSQSWGKLKRRLLGWMAAEPGSLRAAVYESNRLVGWIDVRIRNCGTPDQAAYLRFDALYDHYPEELTDVVACQTLTHMTRYGCNDIYFVANERRGVETARHWDAEELCRTDKYVLKRDSANWRVIQQWLDTLPGKNPDLKTRFCPYPPLDRAEEYCRLINTFFDEMPRERERAAPYAVQAADMQGHVEWGRENKVLMYNYLLLDARDAIVALTNVSVDAGSPQEAFQAMTGVIKPYRGRGLAKWLKAAMFVKVGQDFPSNESFNTIMRAVNKPIQAINAQMGYRLESHGFEFRLSREQLDRKA